MKKVATMNYRIYYTDKKVIRVDNNNIQFEDGSYINGDTNSCYFIGKKDVDFIVERTSEEEIKSSLNVNGRTFNLIPKLIIHDIGDVTLTLNL